MLLDKDYAPSIVSKCGTGYNILVVVPNMGSLFENMSAVVLHPNWSGENNGF